MTFTTLTFVIFLTVVFTAYWLVRSLSFQNALLALASFVFYGWWDWRFCGLMILSAAVDWGLALAVDAAASAPRRKLLVVLSCVGNLTLLGFFKYFNFFQENFVQLAGRFGWSVHPLTFNIVLPIGISFYTFQSMSYIIDVYRRDVAPTRNPVNYLAYVSFFPQLVAGPINRGADLIPQFSKPRIFDYAEAVDGCRQILWGFAKKMIVADALAVHVDAAFKNPAGYAGVSLAASVVFFAFQIYCDFSAYSDIALGTAKLFGFKLMRNFAYPYFSTDLVEFWRRWHISLSTWFRDYVYVPLGGSRFGEFAAARNVFIVFLLSGFWHGPSWNFVIWGAMHGVAVVVTGWVQDRRGVRPRRMTDVPGGAAWIPSLRAVVQMAGTFAFVCFGWVFFRAHSMAEARAVLKPMVSRPFRLANGSLPDFVNEPAFVMIGVLVAIEWMQRRRPHPLAIGMLPKPVRWAIYTLLFWFTLGLQTGESTTFIYFQF